MDYFEKCRNWIIRGRSAHRLRWDRSEGTLFRLGTLDNDLNAVGSFGRNLIMVQCEAPE